MIKGIGNDSAKIMLVGDYGTTDELQQGYALTGSVQETLSHVMREAGLRFDECYRTLYIKTSIPGFKSKAKKVRSDALNKALLEADFKNILQNEIEGLKPNIIVPLGELALNAVAGEKVIERFRGSILPFPVSNPNDTYNPKVIPTYHPRDIWISYINRIPAILDFKRIKKFQNIPNFPSDDYLIWICRSYNQLVEFFSRHKNPEFLTFDIETHHNFITCIGFCCDGNEAVTVPLMDATIPMMERMYIWRKIREVLANGTRKVNQNIKYDRSVLRKFGLDIANIFGDSMLAAHTLYVELPKGLDFLTSVYTEIPYYKDEGKDYNPKLHSFDRMLLYNAKDCVAAWRVFKEQLVELEELKLKTFYFNHVMPWFHIYNKMAERGILVDDIERKKLILKYEMMLTAEGSYLDEIHNGHLNVNSWQQVGAFIYEELRCPKHKHKTDSGDDAYDTDEDTLDEIRINEISDPLRQGILKKILVCRKLYKIIEFLNTPIHSDNRFRSDPKLSGTESGRTSWAQTIDFKVGMRKGKFSKLILGDSLQTVPKHGFEFEDSVYGNDLRKIFVPSPGYVFIEGDLGSAEARVVLALANDYESLELMDKKEFKVNKYGLKDDLHVLTAMMTTLKPFDAITEMDRQDFGKKPRHAGNYDMGAYRLSVMIHRYYKECEAILERFHAGVPKVRQTYHYMVRQFVTNTGYLASPHGRRHDYFGRKDDHTFKQAYSFIPQATVSDHMKMTLQILDEEFPNVHFLSESHDSLLAEVPIEEEELYRVRFKIVAERSISFDTGSFIRPVPITIPLDIGRSDTNWKEMKKIA